MRGRSCLGIFMLLFLSAPTAALADISQFSAAGELDHFVGQNVFGLGHVNLGVVAGVDPQAGLIVIVGRHGTVAWISSSAVLRDGPNLWAPGVSTAMIKVASDANLARPHAVTPDVRIIESLPG